MKTVVDAVNYFNGAWPDHKKTTVWLSPLLGFRLGTCVSDQTICTIDEFDQCVKEMSEGLFVPLAKDTIERDGKIYEIGKVYEFSDNGEKWVVSVLLGKTKKAFESAIGHRKFIREFAGEIGTIKQAPVKLVDGDVYQFDYSHDGLGMGGAVMRYVKHSDSFYFDNTVFKRDHCTNIVRLVPEEK